MLQFHEDSHFFLEALNFTEAETSFPARLVEKDYFCTIVLAYLTQTADTLVFKGGTCLAKIHASFFRLSEDLDFMIPVSDKNTRGMRRKTIAGVKDAFAALSTALPCLQVLQPLSGANNSTQYMGTLGYHSLTTGQKETIKIEVSLREPLLRPAVGGEARTLLINPVNGNTLVTPVIVPCMSLIEAYAEKFRAALSRLEVAIRDFYDLDYAVRNSILQIGDADLVELIRKKLTVRGNQAIDISDDRLAGLRQQVEPQLRPVLRRGDFAEFDIERAIQLVTDMAAKIS